jgi:hypothetical protein
VDLKKGNDFVGLLRFFKMLIFSVRAPKDLIDGSGECGYLCHYGVCSMNIRTFLLYDKSVVDKFLLA